MDILPKFLQLLDPRFRPLNSTAHLHSTANAPHPQCHTDQSNITSACRSTPDVFAREVPIHPSAQLSKPDIKEYPTDIHGIELKSINMIHPHTNQLSVHHLHP